MITALVLIQAERKRIVETAQEVAAVPHVTDVYSVTGDWDIVAVIRMPDYAALDEVVTQNMRKIDGIVKTQTMLAFKTYSKDLLEQSFSIGTED
ncbi:Lrp/AsnC family transcriptional regulator [Deinococcus roseus]|uniref:AsnC family transcriptional regulator n=1 Tax=Deinococcus roseus TaxID=392414 RepID=A0ABQ2CVP1_9DEIO|nr:Lrp/AsnC ligand binding domain-containing protein [Deinococcus roseus]GGJ25504.1 AsnC family transcriptional regulator [Deinococcus roseus]